MNSEWMKSITMAAVSVALLAPGVARAQDPAAAQTSQSGVRSAQTTPNMGSVSGRNEGMKMVPARAALTEKLDANKLKEGEQFKVKLADTVHLKNGPELPHGTVLYGVISTDTMHPGNAKLALRFTEARLKDGKLVPIKATIVGLARPEPENGEGYDIVAGDQEPNSWTPQMLQVDQVNTISGIDLHSRIAGNNSGVFIAAKKDDVKLAMGSELLLAIAPQGS